MKKVFYIWPFIALLAACKTPGEVLPEPDPESKTIKIVKSNCGLSTTSSTEAKNVEFDIEGRSEKYIIEFSQKCRAHADYDEFVLDVGGSFKSISTYKVDRLVIDYFSKPGINFEVLDSQGVAVTGHESTIPTDYPNEGDFGAVLEFPINGNSWVVRNASDVKKPAFYSVRVIFAI